MPLLPPTAIDDVTGQTFPLDSNPAKNVLSITYPDSNGNPIALVFELQDATIAGLNAFVVQNFPHSQEAANINAGRAPNQNS